jgi:hypothetical protein
MFRKLFAVVTLILCGAVSSFAAEIIPLDINFYSTDGGTVKAVGKLPPGVVMKKRMRFSNPALKGFAYPLRIDLNKCKTLKLTFVVTSGSGRIVPSLSTARTKSGKLVYKCTKFVFCDEPTPRKLPFTVGKWTSVYPRGVDVTEGEIITIVAEFEK